MPQIKAYLFAAQPPWILKLNRPANGVSASEEVRVSILQILREHGVATRRALQSYVCADTKASPKQVTGALSELTCAGAITYTKTLTLNGCTIYYLPETDSYTLNNYASMVRYAYEILSQAQLGAIGEQYVRSVLLRSRIYDKVTQVRALGSVEVGNRSGYVDMRATAHVEEVQHPIIVEVKNTGEVFYPRKSLFAKHVALAIEDGTLPMIAVAHISVEAETTCDQVGIAVLHMRRQVLPNSILKHERGILREAFGPEEYDYIELGRPFHRRFSDQSQRDVERVADKDWLGKCALAWEQTRERLRRYKPEEITNMFLNQLAPWGRL